MEEKEKRIRDITKIYYSKPEVIEALLKFAKEREFIPRYFEGFGKRPDTLQYPSDIMGLVNKGATSFHASEEIWKDPLKLDPNLSKKEIDELREEWDLLIDIDSPFLDCSKIACNLIIAALEHHGIKNYGLKFSGNKGFHLIVSGKSFPEEYDGRKMKEMFPEWPRAISEFLMNYIRKDYNKKVGEILTDFKALKERTKLSKEDLERVYCTISNRPAKKGILVKLKCPVCGMEIERRDYKLTKRKLKCLNSDCAGILEVIKEQEYYYSDYDLDPENKKLQLSSDKYPEYFEKIKGVDAEKIANLDLILVAPRHLFRAPYSLHEKTGLASVVLTKEELDGFTPRDASPLRVQVKNFLPENEKDEARKLLATALDWKKGREIEEEKVEGKRYGEFKGKSLEINIDPSKITEKDFPKPIKKLLMGQEDGKKRGLFILITFFRSLGFQGEVIRNKINDWNKLNTPPLREGYIKSQIDWHLKQKRKILPPNYDNESFYKDLGLLDGEKPRVKNPIVEVLRKVRGR